MAPEPASAPVMLPVMVPNVQLKELGALAVKEMAVEVPLHIVLAAALVTVGGATIVMESVSLKLLHPTVFKVLVATRL